MTKFGPSLIRTAAAALLVAAALSAGGCRKPPEPPPRGKLTIESAPAGAKVFCRGKELGTTPSSFNGPPGTYLLRLEKSGFEPSWAYAVVRNGETTTVAPKLKPAGSAVLIASRPAGAEVRQGEALLGSTPLVLRDRTPGEYELQVLKPGYAERQIRFSVENHRPQEVMVSLDSNIGRLQLDSEPSQARLFLNGRDIGYTPFNAELDEGRYEVKIEKEGFVALESFIIVTRDQQTRKTFALAGLPGSITVNSDPAGASVFLDGELIGVTPLERADVPSGVRKITVGKDGFDSSEGTVEVAAGAKSEYSTVLGRSTGGIDLSVSPVGVKVYVNDKEHGLVELDEQGSQPKMIALRNLAPGNYRITVAHRRATPERLTVAVRVKKGEVARPKAIELWVANAEVKWKNSGLVETGMIYAENEHSITFGSERGVKIPYRRDEFEYIKKLELAE